LATRALVIPLTLLCTVLLLFPLLVAKVTTMSWKVTDGAEVMKIYRAAYPCVMSWGLLVYLGSILRVRLSIWRTMVRDEVYLVGERLHNYVSPVPSQTAAGDKGKGKAKVVPISPDSVDVASMAGNTDSVDDSVLASGENAQDRKDASVGSTEVDHGSRSLSHSAQLDAALSESQIERID
jgi:hypothetical protein